MWLGGCSEYPDFAGIEWTFQSPQGRAGNFFRIEHVSTEPVGVKERACENATKSDESTTGECTR